MTIKSHGVAMRLGGWDFKVKDKTLLDNNFIKITIFIRIKIKLGRSVTVTVMSLIMIILIFWKVRA